MRGDDLRDALDALGWSVARFSDETGIADRTVRRMIKGEASVPAAIARWLAERVASATPAPPKPEREIY